MKEMYKRGIILKRNRCHQRFFCKVTFREFYWKLLHLCEAARNFCAPPSNTLNWSFFKIVKYKSTDTL